MKSTRNGSRGFTLIELLVVIAVIALLVGVLLPALGRAQRSAWKSNGASMQRQFLLGFAAYGNSNDFAIPGVNTSGRGLEDLTNLDILDRQTNKPVQNFDWMSPILDGDSLPAGRLARLHYLHSTFRDPSMQETVQVVNADEGQGEVQQILLERGDFSGTSYLMPVTWQLAGKTYPEGSSDPLIFGNMNGLDQIVELPTSWLPNATRIGQASGKILISDGFNVLTPGDGPQLDAEVWADPIAGLGSEFPFGAFCSDTPINPDSVIFGDPDSSDDIELRRSELSYRHAGQMNTGYFDGHVTSLTVEESRDPRLWFPAGSVLENGAHPTSQLIVMPGEKID